MRSRQREQEFRTMLAYRVRHYLKTNHILQFLFSFFYHSDSLFPDGLGSYYPLFKRITPQRAILKINILLCCFTCSWFYQWFISYVWTLSCKGDLQLQCWEVGPLGGDFVHAAIQPRAPELHWLWLYCSAAAVIIQIRHSGCTAHQHSLTEKGETQEIDNPPEMSPPWDSNSHYIRGEQLTEGNSLWCGSVRSPSNLDGWLKWIGSFLWSVGDLSTLGK